MTLGQLISALRLEAAQDPNRVLPLGFTNPHSYRGYYEELAFEPEPHVTVAESLKVAESANGSTYQGWKGGDYTMTEHSDVYLAMVGCCGEELGPITLALMLGRASDIDWASLRR